MGVDRYWGADKAACGRVVCWSGRRYDPDGWTNSSIAAMVVVWDPVGLNGNYGAICKEVFGV